MKPVAGEDGRPIVSVAAAAARGPVVRMAYQGIGMGIGRRTASACMSLIKLNNLI
jgi:hypothetical protein